MARRKSNNNRCDVAMLVDVETGEHNHSGSFVPERGSMEEHIFNTLRTRYAGVAVVPFGPDVAATLAALAQLKPRVVFNLTEWVDGDRTLDHAIAGLLELMNYCYTGTGPAGMQLSRDKVLAKHVVAAAGIDVPRGFTLARRARIENPGLPFPLIVKPRFGDGSDSIFKSSLVRTPLQLLRQVRALRARFAGPLLCEEFIAGRDLYVGVVGNAPRVLAPIELAVASRAAGAPGFATYRLKHDPAYRARWSARYRLAKLPAGTLRRARESSRKAFHALQLRDYARIDYRLAGDGRLVFIEANPNPDLTPHSFGRNMCLGDMAFGHLIPYLVETARKRSHRR